MSEFINIVREAADGSLNGVSDSVIAAMIVIGGLLIVASIIAFVISICLGIAYAKYNRKKNSCQKTGEQVARTILDRNGLTNIKVSANGSILFGNSYSHFFKKVRLRRLTWKKDSVTSLAMAAEKSSLAILDKEGDPDMKSRIRMTPIIYFGPLAFVPLVLIGALLDVFIFNTDNSICLITAAVVGFVIYLISFIMALIVLKTEKKAQKKALQVLKEEGLATEEEIKMSKKLFKLYNIEYVNDMVIALLELVYRVLQIIAYAQNNDTSSSK